MNAINFHDTPGKLKIDNGIVFIDFYDKALPTGNLPGNEYSFGERLVLTIPALVELHRLVSKAVKSLEEQGVITLDTDEQGNIVMTKPQE